MPYAIIYSQRVGMVVGIYRPFTHYAVEETNCWQFWINLPPDGMFRHHWRKRAR